MIIGFSAGSAACGAAKAAAYMLLFKWRKSAIEIETPRGLMHTAILKDINVTNDSVSCAVKKDGGIEPDIYEADIYAKVRLIEKNTKKNQIDILAGEGIGTMALCLEGLEAGEAAIYPQVKTMIEKNIKEVLDLADIKCHLEVTISIPGGEDISNVKYDHRLGIVDGLRVIGDKKNIEPINAQTVIKSIYVELHQRHEFGFRHVAVTNGSYGRAYFDKTYRYEIIDKCVRCSDYIGETVDMALGLGFKTIILSGNIEKFIKIAGGIMNTHSKESDSRLDILCSIAIMEGANTDTAREILNSEDVDSALDILKSAGIYEPCMDSLINRIINYIKNRTKKHIDIECVLFTNSGDFVAQSKGAVKWLTLLSQEASR